MASSSRSVPKASLHSGHARVAFERQWDKEEALAQWEACCRRSVVTISVGNLASSRHRIIPKYVCFDLQLSKTVLENITDADDPY